MTADSSHPGSLWQFQDHWSWAGHAAISASIPATKSTTAPIGLAGAVAAPSPPPIERHWPGFGPAVQLARIFQNPAQMKRVGSGVARVRKKARAIPPDKKVTH